MELIDEMGTNRGEQIEKSGTNRGTNRRYGNKSTIEQKASWGKRPLKVLMSSPWQVDLFQTPKKSQFFEISKERGIPDHFFAQNLPKTWCTKDFLAEILNISAKFDEINVHDDIEAK